MTSKPVWKSFMDHDSWPYESCSMKQNSYLHKSRLWLDIFTNLSVPYDVCTASIVTMNIFTERGDPRFFVLLLAGAQFIAQIKTKLSSWRLQSQTRNGPPISIHIESSRIRYHQLQLHQYTVLVTVPLLKISINPFILFEDGFHGTDFKVSIIQFLMTWIDWS